MIKKTSIIFTIFIFIVSFFSCATLVSKSEYPVRISSDPSGVKISIKNRDGIEVYSGITPTTVSLKAGAGYFKGEEYVVSFTNIVNGKTFIQKAKIQRNLDPWYTVGNAGNFILSGVFGIMGWLIIDPASGAMWTLDNLHVDINNDYSKINNKIHIVTIDDVPNHLKNKLIRIN